MRPRDEVARDEDWRGSRPRRSGIHVRLGYRLLSVPEVKDMQQHLGDDSFHAVALDLYPHSGVWRIGLSTQLALESGGDFIASEGLLLGLTLPHAHVSPFVEAGVHAGVGRRSIWVPIQPEPSDFPTVLLLVTGELGVDLRLSGRTAVTVAVGLQRSSFYLSLGDPMSPLVMIYDTTGTLKVGIGY